MDFQPDRLQALWELDVQTIEDVKTILIYKRDVSAAMQSKEDDPIG